MKRARLEKVKKKRGRPFTGVRTTRELKPVALPGR
jgi:hypothetical protein